MYFITGYFLEALIFELAIRLRDPRSVTSRLRFSFRCLGHGGDNIQHTLIAIVLELGCCKQSNTTLTRNSYNVSLRENVMVLYIKISHL